MLLQGNRKASTKKQYEPYINGFKVTAVGGEDSISSMHASKLVGSVRTYVYTGERGLSMPAWFEGLRAGRAFVTTGPLVTMTVNGRGPGEEVALPAGGGTIELSVDTERVPLFDPVTGLAIR